MKTALALLLLAILATSALAGEESSVGRYQLHSGTIEMIGKSGASSQVRELYRIDTKTGKVWSYVVGESKDGKLMAFWSPIPEIGESR